MANENIPGQNQHQPLLNPSVILEVFKYVTTAELRVGCRGVCKVWYEEANRVLRKRRALKIYLTNYDTLEEYFQSSQTQRKIFNDFYLGGKLQLKDARIQRFFIEFGPFIKSLDLGKSQWPNASLRKLLSASLTNLEELSMQLREETKEIANDEIPPEPSHPSVQENGSAEYLRPVELQNGFCNDDATESQSKLPIECPPLPPPLVTNEYYSPPQQAPKVLLPYSNGYEIPNKLPSAHVQKDYSNPAFHSGQEYYSQTWSYPTPPPAPGDYYSSISYGTSYQSSTDWYHSNPLPPQGDWQNNYNTSNSATNYNPHPQNSATSYNPHPHNPTSYNPHQNNRPIGLDPPQGDWYYCNFSKEWYWSSQTPHVHTEYSTGIAYHLSANTPTPTVQPSHHHQSFGYQTDVHPPFQNFGLQSDTSHYQSTQPEKYHSYSNGNFHYGSDQQNGWNWSHSSVQPANYSSGGGNSQKHRKNHIHTPAIQELAPKIKPSPETHSTLWKMKTLNISIDYNLIWSPEKQDGLKIFFRDLLLGMPNLKKISCTKLPAKKLDQILSPDPTVAERHVSNLLPLLEVLSDPNGPPLHYLKCFDIPLNHWEKIHQLCLSYPLEQLVWKIHSNLDFGIFKRCIWKLSRTLKKLELNLESANSNFLRHFENQMPSFKCLEKVKELTLTSQHNASLGFVLKFPALQTLIVDCARPNFNSLFDSKYFKRKMANDANRSLKSLTIRNCSYLAEWDTGITLKVVRKISKAFPCIKNLQLEFVGDEALRAICKYFQHLEVLKISKGLFKDACLIGLPMKCLDAFLRRKCRRKSTQEPVRPYPYIGNLKRLKELDICSKYITDFSVLYGVMDCKSLTSLTLRSNGITNLSIVRIADEMNLKFLKTVGCNQITRGGVKYVKEKMPTAQLSLNDCESPLSEVEIKQIVLTGTGYKIALPRLTFPVISSETRTNNVQEIKD